MMRFYFQDKAAGNFATKCIRVSSTATTQDVIETLAEKFRPDMRMLSSPKYSLYEVHVSGGQCGQPGLLGRPHLGQCGQPGLLGRPHLVHGQLPNSRLARGRFCHSHRRPCFTTGFLFLCLQGQGKHMTGWQSFVCLGNVLVSS